MSAEIWVTIRCDGPECTGSGADTFRVTLLRRDLEGLRQALAMEGWHRFRVSNTSSLGDYCPACAEKLLTARADRKRGAP